MEREEDSRIEGGTLPNRGRETPEWREGGRLQIEGGRLPNGEGGRLPNRGRDTPK